ncbi:MAG: N-glycosylase/DNA lyase [Candidatus Altiarchaeota archaeon]
MDELIRRIRELKKGRVGRRAEARLREFGRFRKGGDKELFGEMCFCLLTANYAAEPAMRIQKEVGEGFLGMPGNRLAKRLRALGYRFPNARAGYIVEARKHCPGLGKIIRSKNDELELREWVVKNVKGLGYKEASHFLRNIGYRNLAIVDFHIIDILAKNRLIKRPKTLTRRRYLEIESVLQGLGKRLRMDMAELDLYLWYLETGKILK